MVGSLFLLPFFFLEYFIWLICIAPLSSTKDKSYVSKLNVNVGERAERYLIDVVSIQKEQKKKKKS